MSDLASVGDLALLLGLAEGTDEDLLTVLLDGAVALFESQTGRTLTPFASGVTGRVEILDARPATRIWLDYPIQDVTAIALGVDVANPDETLNPDDPKKVSWRVGQRVLMRTDGRLWTTAWGSFDRWPSFIQVTYDTQDDLPADAKLAVLQLASAMYRRGGAEGIRSETLDNYSVTFAQAAAEDPAWQLAVNHHRRLVAA